MQPKSSDFACKNRDCLTLVVRQSLTFPIGCPQIIFHKQAPLYIPELNVAQDKLTVSGQVNFSSHLYADGNTEMIVVVFHPHAMSMFLNIPTSHLSPNVMLNNLYISVHI